MSRNGVGTCWLTTRIISSGVIPLAASAADERPGARADVDVELVDRAVHRQQVEGAQGADLVDAAGEAAAAEDERGLRAPRAAAPRARGAALGCRSASLRLVEVDDLPHAALQSTERRGRAGPRFPADRCPIGRRPARIGAGRSLPWLAVRVPRRLATAVSARSRCSSCSPRRRWRSTRSALRASLDRAVGGTGRRPRRRAGVRPDDREHALRAQRRAPRGSPPRSRSSSRPPTALRRFGPDARLDDDASSATASSTPQGGLERRPRPRRRRRPDARPRRDRAARAARSATPACGASAARSLGDESASTRRRGSPRTGGAYDSDMGGVLGALTVDRGFSTRPGGPALAAARAARARAARRAASASPGGPRTGDAPAGRAPLAAVQLADDGAARAGDQRPVGQLLRRDAAEGPRRHVRRAAGRRPPAPRSSGARWRRSASTGATSSTAPASRARTASARSRSSACSPRCTARRRRGAFEASLAVAGRTGTLRKRLRGTAAAGACRGKTGTLNGVSALAGLCSDARGPHDRVRDAHERRDRLARARRGRTAPPPRSRAICTRRRSAARLPTP